MDILMYLDMYTCILLRYILMICFGSTLASSLLFDTDGITITKDIQCADIDNSLEFPLYGVIQSTLQACVDGEVYLMPPSDEHIYLINVFAVKSSRIGSVTLQYRSATEDDLTTLTNAVNRQDFQAMTGYILSWINVTRADPRYSDMNNFQAALCTDGTQSFVIFNYDSISWGHDAKIGFEATDESPEFVHKYSGNAGVNLLSTFSNAGVPGRYIYRVDEAEITPYDKLPNIQETTSSEPTSRYTTSKLYGTSNLNSASWFNTTNALLNSTVPPEEAQKKSTALFTSRTNLSIITVVSIVFAILVGIVLFILVNKHFRCCQNRTANKSTICHHNEKEGNNVDDESTVPVVKSSEQFDENPKYAEITELANIASTNNPNSTNASSIDSRKPPLPTRLNHNPRVSDGYTTLLHTQQDTSSSDSSIDTEANKDLSYDNQSAEPMEASLRNSSERHYIDIDIEQDIGNDRNSSSSDSDKSAYMGAQCNDKNDYMGAQCCSCKQVDEHGYIILDNEKINNELQSDASDYLKPDCCSKCQNIA